MLQLLPNHSQKKSKKTFRMLESSTSSTTVAQSPPVMAPKVWSILRIATFETTIGT
jgi:hypothetical protein